MRELKKLLVGFLLFSCAGWALAAQPTAKERRIFREAYGLYWSGKAELALKVLRRQKNYTIPYPYYLMGLCYEYLGEYDKAVRFLGKSWRDFGFHKYTASAAVEEAAIRAYVFENPIGASVTLELAREKMAKAKAPIYDLCVVNYNLWYVKKDASLIPGEEKAFVETRCRDILDVKLPPEGLPSKEEVEYKGENDTDNDTGG